MAVQRKSGLYAVSVGDTLLGGITQQNLVTGTEVRSDKNSGDVYARFLALYAQKIAPGFTTTAIAAALGLCATTGASLADMTGGLKLYAQKHADGGTRTAGAAHRSYGFARGILLPRQLTVSHQGDATLSYDAVIVSADGINAPMTITDATALPASAVGPSERFTLGPVTVGGVALSQKTQLQIDFGIDAVAEGADSDIWDTLASIREIQSTIRITGSDPEWLKSTNIPLEGKAATHLNTSIYLRKRAHGGTFVAGATEEHIKITADGLAYVDQVMSASGNNPSETTLVIATRYDGTNAPLVVDTAAALPS
ncbi:MAG: hypothetical protein ACOY3Y_01645 [Acidobacteriota bacterium]